MNAEQIRVANECARGSLTGEMTFPEVVGKLSGVGVERYHADYSRQEITYYLHDGDSLVVPASMNRIQRRSSFLRRPSSLRFTRASVTNIVTPISSARRRQPAVSGISFKSPAGAIYFGRSGDMHIERFP